MNNTYNFTFQNSPAMTALKQRQHDDIKYYNARNELFKLSLMADYDQLVCLPSLTTDVTLVWNPFTKIIEPLRCEVSGEPIYEFYLDDKEAKIISPSAWK